MDIPKYVFEVKKRNRTSYKLICKVNPNFEFTSSQDFHSLNYCIQLFLKKANNIYSVDKIVFKNDVIIDDLYLHFLVFFKIYYFKFYNVIVGEDFNVRFGKYKNNVRIITKFKKDCCLNQIVGIIKKLNDIKIYDTNLKTEVSVMLYNRIK